MVDITGLGWHATNINRDGLLRLDNSTNLYGGVSDINYDAANRPLERKLPSGQKITWTYAASVTTGWTRT